MAENTGEKKGKFEPKNPVKLEAPKDDPITLEHLAKCDGEITIRASIQKHPNNPTRKERGIPNLCGNQGISLAIGVDHKLSVGRARFLM